MSLFRGGGEPGGVTLDTEEGDPFGVPFWLEGLFFKLSHPPTPLH